MDEPRVAGKKRSKRPKMAVPTNPDEIRAWLSTKNGGDKIATELLKQGFDDDDSLKGLWELHKKDACKLLPGLNMGQYAKLMLWLREMF